MLKQRLAKWCIPSLCLTVISCIRMARVEVEVTAKKQIITFFSDIEIILLKSKRNSVLRIVLKVPIVMQDNVAIAQP